MSSVLSNRTHRRPFAVRFALSHACFMTTYPLAGWLLAAHGSATATLTPAAFSANGPAAGMPLWPRHDVIEIAHGHAYVIDDLHRRSPRNG